MYANMHAPSHRQTQCDPEVVYAEDTRNTSSGELHVLYNVFLSWLYSMHVYYIHVCVLLKSYISALIYKK